MNLPIEHDVAKPVAWVWRCPECRVPVMILASKGNLDPQLPCEHFILARASGERLAVEYARGVAEPETGPLRMPKVG